MLAHRWNNTIIIIVLFPLFAYAIMESHEHNATSSCCNELTHFQESSFETAQNNISSRKLTNFNQLIQDVRNEDEFLNNFLPEAWRHINQFLTNGYLFDGKQAINLTNEYICRRRVWICCMDKICNSSKETLHHLDGHETNLTYIGEKLIRFCCENNKCRSDNESEKPLLDEKNLEEIKEDLCEIDSFLQMTGKIYELAIKDKILHQFRNECKHVMDTYFTTHDYGSGKKALQTFKNYSKLQKNASETVRNLIIRLNQSHYFSFPWVRSFLSMKTEEDLEPSLKIQEERIVYELGIEDIMRNYVDIIMNVLFVLVGVVLNGVLLLMFVLNKEVRKPMNIMIFNLAVSDIFNIVTNVPLYYVYTYYKSYMSINETECEMIYDLRVLGIYVSAFSVVGLSFQRFWGIQTQYRNICCKSPKWNAFMCLIVVWTFSIGLCVFYSSIVVPENGYCFNRSTPYSGIPREVAKYVELVYFLLFCFLFPSIVATFSFLIARKLNKSAKNMPGEVQEHCQKHARYRSARVVTALAVVFAISNMPRSIWFFVLLWIQPKINRLIFLCFDRFTFYLRFSNTCFNPVALYVGSRTFRSLFQYYLFRCSRYTVPKTES